MAAEIVNRVANSPLVSLDLEQFYFQGERVVYDLKENLFQGLILREKDFRDFVKSHDWQQYAGKAVAITCTADAIVPKWAYMLLASKLQPYAVHMAFGDLQALESSLMLSAIAGIPAEAYRDKMVVVKGCGKYEIPEAAYIAVTNHLLGVVKSLMFGEPCSTVPVYKKPKSTV